MEEVKTMEELINVITEVCKDSIPFRQGDLENRKVRNLKHERNYHFRIGNTREFRRLDKKVKLLIQKLEKQKWETKLKEIAKKSEV